MLNAIREDNIFPKECFTSQDQSFIDQDETGSQDTVVEPLNSTDTTSMADDIIFARDHEQYDIADSENLQNGVNVEEQTQSNSISETKTDIADAENFRIDIDLKKPTQNNLIAETRTDYKIESLNQEDFSNDLFTDLTDFVMIENQGSDILDALKEISLPEAPEFYINDEIIAEKKTFELDVSSKEEPRVVTNIDAVSYRLKKLEEPKLKTLELMDDNIGLTKSFIDSESGIKSEFNLPEWENQDFGALFGYFGDENQKNSQKIVRMDNFKDAKEFSIHESEFGHTKRLSENISAVVNDDYKKLETSCFQLNLPASSSIDGLSQIANEWEDLQEKSSNKRDGMIQYVSIKNVLLQDTCQNKSCSENKTQRQENSFRSDSPKKSEENQLDRKKYTDNMTANLHSDSHLKDINSKSTNLSIFDQKLPAVSSKIEEIPSIQNDLCLLKGQIEPKNLVIDTGKFEKREESKFVQQPKKKVGDMHQISTKNSSNLKKVSFRVYLN